MNYFNLLFISIIALNIGCSAEATKETNGTNHSEIEVKAASQENIAVSPLKQLTAADAPKTITYKGEPSEVSQFSDKEGEHLIVVAETGQTKSAGKNSDMQDMEMNVYHLRKNGENYTEVWKAQDYVRNCEFDLVLGIRPESMEVTDLDKDGIAEISFVYYLTCTSDVSPYQMKLLMYEGADKYALRGTAKVMDIKSAFTPDAALKAAPADFLKFATEKWAMWEDQAAG